MTKVVCTIPGTRFNKFGVNFPAGAKGSSVIDTV